MVYVERDPEGRVIAVRETADAELEQLPLTDGAVLEFLERASRDGEFARLLALLDLKTIRIVEDLIDLLVRRDIIMFTDLPPEAQQKLLERKRVRQMLAEEEGDVLKEDELI